MHLRRIICCTVGALTLTARVALPQAVDGRALFEKTCASCHAAGGDSRAPSLNTLRTRTSASIVAALTDGLMREQGRALSPAERRAVADYLAGATVPAAATPPRDVRCTESRPWSGTVNGRDWNGTGPDVTNARFQPAERAGLSVGTVPRLRLKWAFGFPNATASGSQPTVVGGRLFVGSQSGAVYALDAATGCIYWTFNAQAQIRPAVVIGARRVSGGRTEPTAYFGDMKGVAYAVDARSGDLLWARRLDDHPQARIVAAPTVYQDRVYFPIASLEETLTMSLQYECCRFRGSVVALDSSTGDVVWRTYTIAEEPTLRGRNGAGTPIWGPAGAGVWASPTVDAKRGLLYVATGNQYSDPPQPTANSVLALDLQTGAMKWARQVLPNDVWVLGCRPEDYGGVKAGATCPARIGPDFDLATPPMLTTLASGRDVIVIGQKSGDGWALDPASQGKILWRYTATETLTTNGGIMWATGTDGEFAYFGLTSPDHPQPGGLHAVRLDTGRREWFTPPAPPTCAAGPNCNAGQATPLAIVPGVVFSGSNDGGMRAFSTRDGRLVWEFDTNREFHTVNGVPAKGGGIGAQGPTIVDGMLYFNSGGGSFAARPGNVLLAFGID